MKINIEAIFEGEEIVQTFLDSLSSQNIKTTKENVKIFVKSKDNKDIEIPPERLRVVFNQH